MNDQQIEKLFFNASMFKENKGFYTLVKAFLEYKGFIVDAIFSDFNHAQALGLGVDPKDRGIFVSIELDKDYHNEITIEEFTSYLNWPEEATQIGLDYANRAFFYNDLGNVIWSIFNKIIVGRSTNNTMYNSIIQKPMGLHMKNIFIPACEIKTQYEFNLVVVILNSFNYKVETIFDRMDTSVYGLSMANGKDFRWNRVNVYKDKVVTLDELIEDYFKLPKEANYIYVDYNTNKFYYLDCNKNKVYDLISKKELHSTTSNNDLIFSRKKEIHEIKEIAEELNNEFNYTQSTTYDEILKDFNKGAVVARREWEDEFIYKVEVRDVKGEGSFCCKAFKKQGDEFPKLLWEPSEEDKTTKDWYVVEE